MMKAMRRVCVPLVLLLALLMPLSGVSKASAAPADTVDISTSTWTKHYMLMPTKGMKAFFVKGGKDGVDLKQFTRSHRLVTLNIIFENITYTDPQNNLTSKVMVTKATTLDCPGKTTSGYEIRFVENLKINIRESYYNYFSKLWGSSTINFESGIKFIALFNDGEKPVTLSTKYSYWGTLSPVFKLPGIQLKTEEVPTDPNDPNSPDFELGDNGGVLVPIETDTRSALRSLYDWLADIFNWKLSYGGFLCLFWLVVGLIGLAILLPLFRSLFGSY